MDMRWDLKNLYSSFDDPKYQEDFNKIVAEIEDLKNWSSENFNSTDNAEEKINQYLTRMDALTDLIDKYYSYAELVISVESNNQAALNSVEKIESILPNLTVLEVTFQKFLTKITDIKSIINSNDSIKTFEFHIYEIINKAKYTLDEKSESLIAQMVNTGSNAWSKLQSQLTSTHLVDIELDGEQKQLPLSVVRNLAYDNSEDIRKKAYEAELKSYTKIEKSSAACLNGIKGEVITLSKLKGYESPLEKTLLDARMDKETLYALISAMEESLPVFRKYLKKKAELLGHKNGLPFYDLFAPIGDEEIKFTYEEASEFIINNFNKFSNKLGDYAKHAFQNNWIDAEPREGKVGGAFCANLHCIGESRILANFDGSLSNTITLAHELGHGYHGLCLKDEKAINSEYSMPVAETASIFCETIVTNAALAAASPEQKISILEEDLQGATQVIVDIYSRYLFETELFKRREEGSLSVEKLCEIMLDAQKKAYGDGLDPEYLHPYMWINKPHYYYASHNFYNFPYAFGLLFGKGLYAIYLEKGEEFLNQYDNLLAATGKNSVYDVGQMMNIDLHDINFFRNGLKIIEKSIEEYVKL